jgi:hypothetical protein
VATEVDFFYFAKYEISVKVNLISRNFVNISGSDPDRIGSDPDWIDPDWIGSGSDPDWIGSGLD